MVQHKKEEQKISINCLFGARRLPAGHCLIAIEVKYASLFSSASFIVKVLLDKIQHILLLNAFKNWIENKDINSKYFHERLK